MAYWHEKIQPLNEQLLADTDLYDEYARIGEMLEGGMEEEDAAYMIFGPPLTLPEGTQEVLWRR